MLSETDRDLIKKAFQVPVHDSYGLREGGLIGYECEKGVMHSMDEQLILETIDPQTLEPCEKEGELVLTNVTGTAFPVIRYRTGDIVTLSKKKCECGKTLSSLKVSGGRAVEFVVAKDGRWIVGYSFIYIARSVKGIVKFQIIQEKIGAILIRITVDDNFPEDGKAQVEAAAAARLKSGDKIFVEIVEDIKPAPSGKYRPVISKPAEDLIKQRVFT